MIRNLDVAALRSFVTVAEAGGVTRAAQRLHLTQSAVSMQIKRLEELLGAQLLEREGRGVALTRAGEEMLSDARKLVTMNDELWERMTAPSFVGEITLGVPHDILFPNTPLILRRFDRAFPDVRVNLVSSLSIPMLKQFEQGELDVVLTTESECRPPAELLQRLPLVWVGAEEAEAWRRDPVPIAFEKRCIFRGPAIAALEGVGKRWDWISESDNYEGARATIAADLAINTMLKGVHAEGIVEIDHGGELPPLPHFCINLYVTKGPNAELAECLANFVRDAFVGRNAKDQAAA
ncbi:MAG: LysR family transcriptional regulator [Pseudomonadota bacterium]